jgi:transposase-like protein
MRTIRKYSEEDRNNYLRLWQESGLTQQAFCQEHDLVLRTFNTWKKQNTLEVREENLKLRDKGLLPYR